ncbi:ABC transporter family substrate-binding protein [Actinacidiphila sp. bgisy167]|uniref:ABC transporter family substrate-binding protein n=1 Tax=Actinacidiphila sp. bgisy167 TaxID=3413797 RepID=UPI003D7225B1
MNRKSARLATAVVVSAGLLAGATACGASKGDANASAPKAPPKATLNQINPVDPAKLRQGGTLNFPVDEYSTQWNSLNAASQNTVAVTTTMAPLLPSLFHSTPDNKQTPNPNYLTKVTTALKHGKQVTTYVINPKARWSDGTPITWKDFRADWVAQNGKNPGYTPVGTTGYEEISSVTQGSDARHVVVTYGTPYSEWRTLFSPLYPASQIDTPHKFDTSYKNHIPVTAGPFKVSKMDPTTKVVSEVRDPDWWGPKPVLDGINFRTLDAASTPGAFASGEIDVEDIGPDVAAYKQAQKVPHTSIRVAGAPNLRQLVLNGKSPLLKDERVRQAVFMALDREAIGKADLNGLPFPAKPLNNHFLVNNDAAYRDNAGSIGRYDPTAAAKRLDAAGWKLHDGVREKDGKPLALTLAIPSGTPIAANEAQLFTAMLKNVGITLHTAVKPSDDFFNDISAGKFDLTLFSGIGAVPFFPLTNSAASFVSPQHGNIGQNYSRIGTAAIDADMRKAGTEVDHSAYLADLNAADTALWKLAADLPLYQRPQIVAAKSDVANYGAFGFQDTDWSRVGFTS